MREHLLQPPPGHVGEREQPQRLPGGGAVDDDRLPLAGLVVALELQQREQLVQAWRDRQLLGRDPVDPALDQHLAQPLGHRGPVALHLLLGLDLLAPQALGHQRGIAAQRRLQRLRQRVGGIRRGQPARSDKAKAGDRLGTPEQCPAQYPVLDDVAERRLAGSL